MLDVFNQPRFDVLSNTKNKGFNEHFQQFQCNKGTLILRTVRANTLSLFHTLLTDLASKSTTELSLAKQCVGNLKFPLS